MRVLIACEESQAVCKAFRALGHEAYSCDILPSSGGHPEWHIQGDVLEQLGKEWDMIIAFPPCTHLAVSGAKHFAQKIADGRQQEGIDFFMLFANHSCPKICIENPVGIMSTKYRKPDQIIQPYQFGHPSKKTTCLWLKGLPLLTPTSIVEPIIKTYNDGSKFSADYAWSMAGKRGKTYQGIADAMANQWG
jgi:site-specific DNA-cytosine methylase